MNREQARKLGPVITAFGEGADVECSLNGGTGVWTNAFGKDLTFAADMNWRIKGIGRWRLFFRRIWIAVHEVCAP
jgi:hypothetical protein